MLNKLLFSLGAVTCDKMNVKLMSKEWKNTDFEQQEWNETELNLNASSFTISGFGSGASLAANLMNMYPESIDGVGILGGDGPCAARALPGCEDASQQLNYDTSGYSGKPFYYLSGSYDPGFKFAIATNATDWTEEQGAHVFKDFVDGFGHVFPISADPS